ncbi:hypothetical protein N7519_011507 [Penicillium mononematosum]|uniref:uncharacterized protein n=1 Tax=Penicillium mononematosum TaxID=268346 RepID=UPI0025497F72|nr:uncharacterized protein N7519_011507 [Penicillium mononematosum]KAJ6181046.1 hypothetical protein N7519_011507 [Penicillium mononematosum]
MLGFGGYSTVWLALDNCLHRYVAVKVGIADSALHETNILRALADPGHDAIPTPLDEFELNGPNGTHLCYTMTPARCNLREVSFSRLFPHIHLRNVLVKLPSNFDHLSVEQLYEEYDEPETVFVKERDGKPLPPNVPAKAVIPLCLGKDAEEFLLSDTHLLLSDFGETFAPDLETRRGEDCHTPLAMRAPEARFGPQAPLSIFSRHMELGNNNLGDSCIPKYRCAGSYATELVDTGGSEANFFDDDGRPKEGRYVWPGIEEVFEEAAIIDLMRRMFAFRPEERPTIQEVLQSDWMVKWALPELERSSQME